MITGPLKTLVDHIWEAYWMRGISNSLTVIKQFTFLLIILRLDERQQLEEKKASTIGTEAEDALNTKAQAILRGCIRSIWTHKEYNRIDAKKINYVKAH